ncbi:site-2 protease family protein [Kordiimonas lipolytica]|uniref:Site-2 protease family protein n=1 Tax=Kordiimonas lipolytica TaxID=1662421 RepID=A0ABV8U9H8_9PROT|nr:site-2 protease family protein [Kordiimonas lipolytica]
MKITWKTVLSLMLCALVGAVFGAMVARYGDDFLPSLSEMGLNKATIIPLVIISLLIGYFLSILVHELGHMLAGRLVGMRPLAFVVGPFVWSFDKGRQLPSFEVRGFFPGGFAYCLPEHGEQVSRRQYMVFVAGGPIASLLLLVLCALGLGALPALYFFPLMCTLLITAFIGVYNLMPITIAGLHTDGKRFLEALRETAGYRVAVAQFHMSALVIGKTAISSWPDESVKTLIQAPKGSPEWRAGHCFRYYQARDADDHGAARQHLEHMTSDIEGLTAFARDGYVQEKLVFQALYEGGLEEVAPALAKTKPTALQDKHSRHQVRSIAALARGEVGAALSEHAKAVAALPKARFSALTPLTEQDLAQLKRLIDAAS